MQELLLGFSCIMQEVGRRPQATGFGGVPMKASTSTNASGRNPWPALVVLGLGFFMILLDGAIVNVAVPTMVASLHATLDQILWVLNAYLLVFAALLITAGRIGDEHRARSNDVADAPCSDQERRDHVAAG